MIDALADLWGDYTLRNVALGSALLGVVSGVLGCFAVLRRQSLLGDALSHAALPGIAAAYLLTGSKASIVLLLGAAIAAWIGAALLLRVVRDSIIGEDSALGIVLSVFFGLGIVLLTVAARTGAANQAGLDTYLFGQAATLVTDHVVTMAALGGVALAAVALFYKELKLVSFDPAFADSLGFSSRRLATLLTTLLVVAIVIGLQTVGVVLMTSMLIGPGVAARQWTNRLHTMILIGGVVGAASGVGGALISVSEQRLPTGPMVVLTLTALVILSLLVAPERGLLWDAWRRHGAGMRAPTAGPTPRAVGAAVADPPRSEDRPSRTAVPPPSAAGAPRERRDRAEERR